MFTEEQSTVKGTHHQIVDAWNSPRPVTPGGPPILVGGTGEKKTFRLAAQYADELNINAAFVEMPRKLDALAGHLDRLGRPRRTSRRHASARSSSARRTTPPRPSSPALLARAASPTRREILNDAAVARRGPPPPLLRRPDEVVGQVRDLLALGLDGVVVNMLGDGHDPDAVQPRGRDAHPGVRLLI